MGEEDIDPWGMDEENRVFDPVAMTTDKLTETSRVETIAKVLHGVTFNDGEYGARKVLAADPATPLLAEAAEVLYDMIARAHQQQWPLRPDGPAQDTRRAENIYRRLREVGA